MEEVVTKSLVVIRETLDIPTPPPDADDYARIVVAKKDAAVSGLSLGLKSDENRFRARKQDVLDKLYDAVMSDKAQRDLVDVTPAQ